MEENNGEKNAALQLSRGSQHPLAPQRPLVFMRMVRPHEGEVRQPRLERLVMTTVF
jgi:hypothetical protein